jgi:hypothetical protein
MVALPQTLPANKTSLVGLAAFGLFLVVVGLTSSKHPGLNVKPLILAIGVLCCVYAIASMLLSINHLQLDADGMSIKMAFRQPRRVNFADVSPYGFAVVRSGNANLVMWRYRLGAEPKSAWRIFTYFSNEPGYQDALLFNYGGHNTQKMCELLNTVFTLKKHVETFQNR